MFPKLEKIPLLCKLLRSDKKQHFIEDRVNGSVLTLINSKKVRL